MPDVFKILKDLELRAVGLTEANNRMQEGYFASFRSVGLPIHPADYDNPWSPLGSNLDKSIPLPSAADPASAPKTASAQLDENRIFAARVARDQKNYLNSFLLVDDKLSMNSQYSVMPNAGMVSDAWWAIMTGANGIPLDSELDPEMKKAYEAARAKLMDADGNPTAHYQAYLQYQDAYKSKVRAWNQAYAAAFGDPMKLQNWPLVGRSYHDEADEAMDRWVGFGFKEEIENAIATLAAQGTDPAIALIARGKKRYLNSLNEFQSVGQIPYTMLSPESWYDATDDSGWTEYSEFQFHDESHYQASSTSYGGGGGFNVGFWRANASFNHAEDRKSLDLHTSNLSVSLKYCTVDIKRPWLDSSLLALDNWFLMGDYKKGCISDGTFGQHVPADGKVFTFLPSVVTSLILVKDLSLRWDDWQSNWSAKSSDTSGSASIGWGPFSAQGHYSHHEERRDFVADASGESLLVPGIQLIGYVSTILPFSPSVNSADHLEHHQ